MTQITARDRVNKPHIMCHQIFPVPLIPSEFANNIEDPNYWSAFVADLMKRIL